MAPRLRERLAAAAEAFAPGASERLVLPGTPAFTCIADECDALCCRAPYRVDVSEAEILRLTEAGAADAVEERASLALLRQDGEGTCALLQGLRCSAYEARPDGCRQYPFMPHTVSDEEGELPLLLRDLACPGFIGEPLSEAAWDELVDSIRRLQGRGA